MDSSKIPHLFLLEYLFLSCDVNHPNQTKIFLHVKMTGLVLSPCPSGRSHHMSLSSKKRRNTIFPRFVDFYLVQFTLAVTIFVTFKKIKDGKRFTVTFIRRDLKTHFIMATAPVLLLKMA